MCSDTGPACNAVGMIDRKVLGIHHLYARPIYARTKVSLFLELVYVAYLYSLASFLTNSWVFSINFPSCLQECSINSPDSGPLPPDAPSWCQAPFDPEGLLRFVFFFLVKNGEYVQCIRDKRKREFYSLQLCFLTNRTWSVVIFFGASM